MRTCLPTSTSTRQSNNSTRCWTGASTSSWCGGFQAVAPHLFPAKKPVRLGRKEVGHREAGGCWAESGRDPATAIIDVFGFSGESLLQQDTFEKSSNQQAIGRTIPGRDSLCLGV